MRRIAVIGNGGGGKSTLSRTKVVHLRSPRELRAFLEDPRAER